MSDICPVCGSDNTRLTDAEYNDGEIQRFYECADCSSCWIAVYEWTRNEEIVTMRDLPEEDYA